ncbi:uncharacterized protein LOC134842460 [Symsagittifera roscoffensis]|uniref:uncharacterized protein LOC134842460 n=1 Tax=Symsagittifera roscoffensis TaxID=84072 RepID=UPI00307C9EAC
MFYYAKKNGHDVSATSSTLSMEEILFLWLKSLGQALILVQSAFHAGDMPNIDEISGGIIKEVFKVHQLIQTTQYMNAQLAIDEREMANCSPKSGNVSINDLFAGSQCSMVKESEVESTEKQKQSVKCGQQDLADITSFAIVARIDILLALKHDSQMIVQTVEDMAELYAKASSGDCLSLLMTVASSAKNKDAKEVELHCREMLLKNFKRQLKFQGASASSDCKTLNSGSTSNLQIAEKTNEKCLTPDKLLYCVIRYIKLNQELKRLLKEESVSDVEVMDLVMSSIEGIMQEIVQGNTLTATGISKEVQQCNSKLQWLMVQLWNNGLGQADQGKKMEAVKMCNLALSVASRLSKWPGMLAYQKKMRHYFTSALASSSLSSPTPKTLFAD